VSSERPFDAPMSPTADADDETSVHVRRAVGGDLDALAWIVERFTPLLLAQARYRMSKALRRIADPEDLVNEVWAAALPKLAQLNPREGRLTPVALAFLATTMLRRCTTLLAKTARRRRLGGPEAAPDGTDSALDLLPTAASGVVTRVTRAETRGAVLAAIDGLDDSDREILILRGIEQTPNQDAAAVLGLPPNTVAVRFRRALERLRKALPGDVYDALAVSA
jgi:RNA polymerase sigma factor (sigma-70 family)